ncbi:MAG: ribonuclease R [Clostridia bacterium]
MKNKQEILDIIADNAPLTPQALEELVFADEKYDAAFGELLLELETNFDILYTKKGKITTPALAGYKTGQYMIIKNSPYLIASDGEYQINNLNDTRPLPYDIVLAQPLGKSKKVNLVRILTRAFKEYVGVIVPGKFENKNEFEFIPYKIKLPLKLFLKANEIGNAKVYDKIRIKLIGVKKNGAIASEFIETYGSSKTSEANYNAVLDMYDIRTEFPDSIKNIESSIPSSINEEELKSRLDLRDKVIFTIDPYDALDLDDAVSIEKTSTGYTLGVHIADVTNYVLEGSPIDVEALERGTSVYFTDKVVPMLPKELSNGICSLNENEDRLTLSAMIHLNKEGAVLDSEIKKSVIRSVKKCNYTDINAILEGTASEEVLSLHKDLIDNIFLMNELAKKLTKRRFSRGAIDFAEKECKIILNKEGTISSIVPYSRGDSQRMIEEFMLLANEATATFVFWQNIPYVYRVHDEPDNEKIRNLFTVAKGLGYTYKGKLSLNNSLNIQRIITHFKDTPYCDIISILALRSMQRAAYSNNCTGHFGLCLDKYCHFTSPIRRYPDLICHRIIKSILDGEINDKLLAKLEKSTSFAAKQSTDREINATNAERAIEDMYKAIYMEGHIGEKFDAIISSVTNFGFFAELTNTIEGLVHISDISDDYYVFDANTMSLRGEKHKNKYSIGDSVKVICNAVDVSMGQIEFAISK